MAHWTRKINRFKSLTVPNVQRRRLKKEFLQSNLDHAINRCDLAILACNRTSPLLKTVDNKYTGCSTKEIFMHILQLTRFLDRLWWICMFSATVDNTRNEVLVRLTASCCCGSFADDDQFSMHADKQLQWYDKFKQCRQHSAMGNVGYVNDTILRSISLFCCEVNCTFKTLYFRIPLSWWIRSI